MPIRFRCPDCETVLSIATRKAGTPIACPKCGEEVLVPAPGTEPEIDLADEGNLDRDRDAELLARNGSGTAAVVAKMPPLPPVRFEKPDFGRAREAAEGPADTAVVEAVTVPVEDGLFLTRRTAAVLVAFAAAMVGLAFATGFLVGR